MRALITFFRCLPARLDLEWLRWARAELTKHNPMHPELPEIVRRITFLEDEIHA